MELRPGPLPAAPTERATPATERDPVAAEKAKEFEAIFLTQFVDEMLKTTGESAFGSKQQSEMWRSFLSEAVAEHLAEQGGLGLAGHVEQMIGAYSQASKGGGS
jgi:Rod binding domain-containing protein